MHWYSKLGRANCKTDAQIGIVSDHIASMVINPWFAEYELCIRAAIKNLKGRSGRGSLVMH